MGKANSFSALSNPLTDTDNQSLDLGFVESVEKNMKK